MPTPHKQPPRVVPIVAKPAPRYLTVEQWLGRDLPKEDHLLGHLLSTTTRILFSADSGSGKTMLALGLAFAVGIGHKFLRWRAVRRGRVLLIDGEMPRVRMRSMIKKALSWFDAAAREFGSHVKILCAEDYEGMKPLDTEAGQRWLDRFIEREGPFDFIIFDNLQALTSLPLKEEEGWLKIAPWARTLTRRNIGQMWIHHTGKDASKGDYGTSIKRWGMDTVMVGSGGEGLGIDMALKFTKARGAGPGTWDEFEPLQVKLGDDGWSVGEVKSSGRTNKSVPIALKALQQVMASTDTEVVPWDKWLRRAKNPHISKSGDPATQEKQFRRAVEALVEQGKVEEVNDGKYRLLGG